MARKKRLEQSMLHSLLNLVFQKERIPGINAHGKEVLPVILRKTETEYEHIKIEKTVSVWLSRAIF